MQEEQRRGKVHPLKLKTTGSSRASTSPQVSNGTRRSWAGSISAEAYFSSACHSVSFNNLRRVRNGLYAVCALRRASARWRRIRRRSRSESPPQMPNFSPLRRACSRHSIWTSQPAHTALASLVDAPRSGKNKSGSTPRQFARSCHRCSSTSTNNVCINSCTWRPLGLLRLCNYNGVTLLPRVLKSQDENFLTASGEKRFARLSCSGAFSAVLN